MKYKQLAIDDANGLIFGHARYPVRTRRGLHIGGGSVYPELNFTLPPMQINAATFPEIRAEYRGIVTEAIERAIQLESSGVVFEFETLLEMTLQPQLGIELVETMNEVCEHYFASKNFRSEIRLTPNDVRDYERPPRMRSSAYLENMLRLFEEGAAKGGDLLSIESTGGKEIFDDALMMCDLRGCFFALAVLGVRDMKFLWEKIVKIAAAGGRIAGGDTACGFGNTAMVLAEKGYIPRVFAAVIRILTVVRTLVAVEEGATGPDKDCGYEGPFLKAITGTPISMEGKTSACAHLSPVGNIAGACADLWSNESVQNIKLLGGMAPTVYMEQLEYDVRLFNRAIAGGVASARAYQQLLIESDRHLDPQAFILAPDNVVVIAREIVRGGSYLEAAVLGCQKGLELIAAAAASGQLKMAPREAGWIARMQDEIATIPLQEEQFVAEMIPALESGKWTMAEYGL